MDEISARRRTLQKQGTMHCLPSGGDDHVGALPGAEAAPDGPSQRSEPVAHLLGERLVAGLVVMPARVVQPQRALVAALLEPARDVDDRRVPAAALEEPGDDERNLQRR